MAKIISPQPIDYDNVDLHWMVGRAFSDISSLDFEIWRFWIAEHAYIQSDTHWRILDHGSIVLTNQDHGQRFGLPIPVDAQAKAIALLIGIAITAIQVRIGTADIVIQFAGDKQLEILCLSSGYENWQVYSPDGQCLVAQGGGLICAWRE